MPKTSKTETKVKSNIKAKQKAIRLAILMALALLMVVLRAQYSETNQSLVQMIETTIRTILSEENENVVLNTNSDILQIHFFDVGQADSILLTNNNESMLIDAGNNKDGATVVNNIKKLGIEKLDYVIGTHPHADHIGGLDNVISNLKIEKLYMPKIQTNTKTFEDVLDAAAEKNLKITTPKVGSKFMVGNVECEIMLCGEGTNEEQENLNLSSIVVRATYNEQSYLFMADAEKENEQSRTWPQTNVLKVGHHGSNTSTSEEFLNQVQPQIAVIQVGKNNDYFHPHKVILDKLKKIRAKIYRTDEKGNILIESDGINNKVSFY